MRYHHHYHYTGWGFSGIFWGCLLILVGIAIVLKSLMHINLPLFQIGAAFILIWIGMKIILGGFGSNSGVYGYRIYRFDPDNPDQTFRYSYGGVSIDLTEAKPDKDIIHVRIEGSFGAGMVLLNPDTPVRIRANASFGGVDFPDNGTQDAGSGEFRSDSYNKDKPYLDIEASQSFGAIRFVTTNKKFDGRKSYRKAWRKNWY